MAGIGMVARVKSSSCLDFLPLWQLIHSISVVDRDEPQLGHRYYFTLAPEATNNRHFTLWDVKGKRSKVIGQRSYSSYRATLEVILRDDTGHPCAMPQRIFKLPMREWSCSSILCHM
jgi:hypothetical protein